MKCEDVLVEKKAQAIECNGRSGFNSTQENNLCVKKKKRVKKASICLCCKACVVCLVKEVPHNTCGVVYYIHFHLLLNFSSSSS